MSVKPPSTSATATFGRWTRLVVSSVLCCCHGDQSHVLGFAKALFVLQTAGQCMSSPTLLFSTFVCVWARPIFFFFLSSVSPPPPRGLRQRYRQNGILLPLAYHSSSAVNRNWCVACWSFHSYSDGVMSLLRSPRLCLRGTVTSKSRLQLSYAQQLHSQYWLAP